jgi:hypothetical protein
MNWNAILVYAGIVVCWAVFIGAGIWWQTWMSQKIAGRFLNPSRLEKFDPATRQRLEARLRRMPGGREFLARSAKDETHQDSPDAAP